MSLVRHKLLSLPGSEEVLRDSLLFDCLCVLPWAVATCITAPSSASFLEQDSILVRIPKQRHTFARNDPVSGTGTRKSLALISFV